MHTPVLLQQAILGLNIKEDGLYIDATAGEGGHLKEIAAKNTRVLALDWDKEQIENLKVQFGDRKNIIFFQGNYAQVSDLAKENNFFPIDGIIFDFGLSYKQIKNGGKGFSYHTDEETLDMRIDANEKVTAADILNDLSEKELYFIFARFSEDINSQVIARQIVLYRSYQKITQVRQLKEAIDQALKTQDIRTYARIFQALRIAVNHEFENIKAGLLGALKILKPEGRIVVISFHSLEDRLVKQFIKENKLFLVNKKAVGGRRELSFERSAKLRVISKSNLI